MTAREDSVGRLVARDVMSSPVATVAPDTPLIDVARLLSERRISGVPVVDGSGEVVGIVTEGDLVTKVAGAPGGVSSLSFFLSGHGSLKDVQRRCEGITASDAMSRKVVTVPEDTPVREIAAIMARQEIARVPIVRDGRLVGIVTRNDVLRIFDRGDAALASDLRQALGARIDTSSLEIEASDGVITVRGRVDRHSDVRMIEVVGHSLDGVIAVDASEVAYDRDDMSW